MLIIAIIVALVLAVLYVVDRKIIVAKLKQAEDAVQVEINWIHERINGKANQPVVVMPVVTVKNEAPPVTADVAAAQPVAAVPAAPPATPVV